MSKRRTTHPLQQTGVEDALELTLIGPPQVQWQGETLKLTSQRTLPLLAYLTLAGGPVPRQELIEHLWQSGRAVNLRQELGKLRELPGAELWLRDDREQRTLGLRAVSDIHRWQSALERGKYAEVVAAWQRRGGRLLQGLELDFLPQNFEDWRNEQQEALELLIRNALESRAEELEVAGEPARALELLRQLVALDPLSETAHRAIMRLEAARDHYDLALAQFETCRRIIAREFGLAPTQETLALAAKLQAESEARAARRQAALHRLPQPSTPFVGRSRELCEARALLLHQDCRLLTLCGAGGAGKTRLAFELAEQSAEHFEDGLLFMPLAPLQEDSLLAAILGRLLGLPHGDQPEEQLLRHLQDRTLLLVLDNFEHVLGARELVSRILGQAPGCKLLITSRARLKLQGECLYELRGLRYPEPQGDDDLQDYEAVRLFLQSARRLQPRFAAENDDEAYVRRVCYALRGLPLGLELAASWAKLLSVRDIAEHLEQGDFELLESEYGDLPVRHRSLRAALSSSWRLLRSEQQALLSALAVFQGSFSREAARVVCGASLRDLLELADTSLIYQRLPDGDFAMHDAVRWFAARQLKHEPGRERQLHRAAAAYYRAQAAETPADLSMLEPRLSAFHHLHAAGEHDEACRLLIDIDVRYLLRWARPDSVIVLHRKLLPHLEDDALRSRSLNSTGLAHSRLGQLGEAIRCFSEALALSQAAGDRLGESNYLGNLGLAYNLSGELRRALSCHEEALAISRELGDKRSESIDLGCLGLVYGRLGELAEAARFHEAALGLSREVEDRRSEANHLGNLAHIYRQQGDREQALAYAQAALALRRELGDKRGEAIDLHCLASLCEAEGKLEQALEHYHRALALNRETGERIGECDLLVHLGGFYAGQGETDKALRHYRSALRLNREIGDRHMEADILRHLGTVLAAEGTEEQLSTAALYFTALARLPEKDSLLGKTLYQRLRSVAEQLPETWPQTLHERGASLLERACSQAYAFPHLELLRFSQGADGRTKPQNRDRLF